ncbi:hypothetical protein D7322_07875 [Sphingobacterium puteale]|uniref:Uncharacterized protein n=1 Tax=Sphingobacterium puteale TaxID=2420510 RepID=A0A420W0B5_9SPHI|nr:hypothetical protein D7322_07875 [Sphingobacterium puteale]
MRNGFQAFIIAKDLIDLTVRSLLTGLLTDNHKVVTDNKYCSTNYKSSLYIKKAVVYLYDEKIYSFILFVSVI